MVFSHEGLHEQAIECCERALNCYKITDHDLTMGKGEISWGCVEQRPYFRTLHTRATCFEAAGKGKKAKAVYQKLMKLIPEDNLGIRYNLFYLYLDNEELADAQDLAKEYKDQDSGTFLWGDVCLTFLSYKQHGFDRSKVEKCLVKALAENPFVPGLILSSEPLPHNSSTYSPGRISEAIMIARGITTAWEGIEGIKEFFESLMYPGGQNKPPSANEMFDLLALHKLMVTTRDGNEWVMTTNVHCMQGTGLPEFNMPVGTKH